MRTAGFSANTLVHTRDGVVPMQILRAGTPVLTQADDSTERVYRPVLKVHTLENTVFSCIDFWKTVEGWEQGERGGLVVSDDQQIWVRGHGWKDAGNRWGHDVLERHDGGTCEWINRSPLYRSEVEGVAWVDGMVDSTRGSGLGRTIDLRDGKIRFMYEMVPNGDCDPADADWQFVQPAFALEVESHGSYFVGEWGVRVRSVLR
jgi:hypothetical protein